MKKLFNTPLAMFICIAMATVFTACEPEEEPKMLSFVCDGKTIADGSTFITPNTNPDINLIGEVNGKATVVLKSLNQVQITMCAFDACVATLPIFNYEATNDGEITAGAALPLGIHYSPTEDAPYHAEALITAYYEGKEDKAVSFTLVMSNIEKP